MGALRIERDEDVLRVTLARPETRNAFDAELIAELSEAFVDVGKARAVLLAGDGPSFCAGADVEWMRASVDLDFDANVADANALRGMLEAIDRCPAPVVARIQGHALGGGAGLVACADIAVAEPKAVFAFSEVKLGIIPAVISPFALAKIGPELGAAVLRHGRAVRRRNRAADRARARGRRRRRRERSSACSPSSRAPAPEPPATRSGWCSNGPTGRRRPGGSPSGARAPRGRKGCAPSSSGAAPTGASERSAAGSRHGRAGTRSGAWSRATREPSG